MSSSSEVVEAGTGGAGGTGSTGGGGGGPEGVAVVVEAVSDPVSVGVGVAGVSVARMYVDSPLVGVPGRELSSVVAVVLRSVSGVENLADSTFLILLMTESMLLVPLRMFDSRACSSKVVYRGSMLHRRATQCLLYASSAWN